MMLRRLLLLAFLLLIIPVGIIAAPSSTNFVTRRFVVVGGGTADSANFSVTSVIGQPATHLASSPNYRVSGGFFYPLLSNPIKTGVNAWMLYE